ncbi:MAG: response regulator [Nostoc sp. ChiSLP02]|nr:response regulator [Nostoc sp. DedSLP05]MDZ8099974.1 response regulator [Nostoc sp. DedSLP01]MDZ8187631.1 response regulator [Nostoc sp. ChiSLP02]
MTTQNLLRRTVLIADDDNDSRVLLAFLLEQEGWEVKQAKDGREALEKVFQEQPDLLILDHRMPEFTGTEVYHHIQKRGISLTIILVTAYGCLEELSSSLGISYFVSKPFDIPDFLNIIECAYKKSLELV